LLLRVVDGGGGREAVSDFFYFRSVVV
jgi:hypothetical protein